MSTSAKSALLDEYALVARALSSPARLMLLEHLAQAERAVDALAHKTGLTLANVSQHLQQLRRAGLVTSRRDGKSVIYRLTDPEILTLMDMLHRLAGRNLAQVDRILRGLSGEAKPPDPISRDELAMRLAQGSVTLLDVRPEDEYAAGHIPGARQVTLDALDALVAQMDPDTQIVAYCRGPYCIYAHQAVAALRARGFDATRMQGGLPDWRAEGRAVDTAHP